MSRNLDAFDRALLAELQKDARTSQCELGERVNLSPAAVNRRLKRLSDDGVIERFVAQVDPASLGPSETIVVEVSVESERPDLLDALKRRFQACPHVQQCYYVTGDSDFILVLVVRDMTQYKRLTQQLFFDTGNVKRFRTLVVMDRVKVGLCVPVDVRPA